MPIQHPRLEQLRALARGASRLKTQGGQAGLVEQVLHQGARKSQVADQRMRAAVTKAVCPGVVPPLHVNYSRIHRGGRA